MAHDPLDLGDTRSAAWEEFRASFAAPRLQLWMLEELGDAASTYLVGLESRWYEGLLHSKQLALDDPDYDGAVPVQWPAGGGVTFFDADVAQQMYDQLFPHGHAEADFLQASLGLITIGFHSALESYAKRLGLSDKPSLPEGIRSWLKTRQPPSDLAAGIADDLRDCDLTRHLFVHNRGIVDGRYVQRIRECRFIEGERRHLDVAVVGRFAEAVWRSAVAIRTAT